MKVGLERQIPFGYTSDSFRSSFRRVELRPILDLRDTSTVGVRAGLLGADADDLVQTVFSELSAPGGFNGYDRGKGSFRVWLRRRTQWRIADAHRRRAATAPLDAPDSLPAPDAALDEAWIEAVHAEALRRLRETVSTEHFAIFQASVLEEMPTADVLRLYRISRDNLYQIRRRVKAAFESLLKEALDDLDAPAPPSV